MAPDNMDTSYPCHRMLVFTFQNVHLTMYSNIPYQIIITHIKNVIYKAHFCGQAGMMMAHICAPAVMMSQDIIQTWQFLDQ